MVLQVFMMFSKKNDRFMQYNFDSPENNDFQP